MMDVRYGANSKDVKRYTTKELREEFLIEKVFEPNDITSVYSHIDRILIMGCMPTEDKIAIDKNFDAWKSFGVDYLLQRRELGIINIGDKGKVTVDGKEYKMGKFDCLYVGMGAKEIYFESDDKNMPAKFYMASTPAHKKCPDKYISLESAAKNPMGSPKTSNERIINQYIHPAVLETCQLSMGLTILKEGSVWNTMPTHTHERRMEVYFYFDIQEENVVFHFMGKPDETRHIVVGNEQAVISPSWSIHAGCGTGSYSFIWAMAGENREFTDMDHISTLDLK